MAPATTVSHPHSAEAVSLCGIKTMRRISKIFRELAAYDAGHKHSGDPRLQIDLLCAKTMLTLATHRRRHHASSARLPKQRKPGMTHLSSRIAVMAADNLADLLQLRSDRSSLP